MTRKRAEPKPVKAWECGPLTHGKPGRHHVEPPLNLPTPARWCNSMQPTAPPGFITKLMAGNCRPSSDRAVHPSRGGC